MQLKTLLPAFLLPLTALATAEDILTAISTIQTKTIELGETVGSWDGHLLSALPIIVDSTTLLASIKKGTAAAEESEELTLAEAVQVATAVSALADDVQATLDTVVDAKPQFDRLLMSPLILLNLNLEKDASAEFSEAVISKVPAALQAAGEAVAGEIEAAFEDAIEVYSS